MRDLISPRRSSRSSILDAHFEFNFASLCSRGRALAAKSVGWSSARGPWTGVDESGSCSSSEKNIVCTTHHVGQPAQDVAGWHRGDTGVDWDERNEEI